jgi:hypothetical protein
MNNIIIICLLSRRKKHLNSITIRSISCRFNRSSRFMKWSIFKTCTFSSTRLIQLYVLKAIFISISFGMQNYLLRRSRMQITCIISLILYRWFNPAMIRNKASLLNFHTFHTTYLLVVTINQTLYWILLLILRHWRILLRPNIDHIRCTKTDCWWLFIFTHSVNNW